jgi:hypothetical protein
MTKWELIGYCTRHPILAFTAYRSIKRPPAFTEREKALMTVGLFHGLVAWWISTL